MTEIEKKYAELDFILDQILAKIDKVKRIMYAQDIFLLTPGINDYRVNYLKQLHTHRKAVQDQQTRLVDGIDIKEIIAVLQE
jgi:hypothetical protein